MKEWMAPEVEELKISSTENTHVWGDHQDGGTWEIWGIELPLRSGECHC